MVGRSMDEIRAKFNEIAFGKTSIKSRIDVEDWQPVIAFGKEAIPILKDCLQTEQVGSHGAMCCIGEIVGYPEIPEEFRGVFSDLKRIYLEHLSQLGY